MTALKSLGLNFLMLLVASGVLFWVLHEGPEVPSGAPDTAMEGQAPGSSRPQAKSSDHDDSEDGSLGLERLAQNEVPTLISSSTPVLRDSSPTRSISAKRTASSRRPATFPLDLNTAKLEDFIELPGIGEKLGQRLVDYRKAHGGFRSVEDLREVRGIGAKRMERLRPLVVTAGASPAQREAP